VLRIIGTGLVNFVSWVEGKWFVTEGSTVGIGSHCTGRIRSKDPIDRFDENILGFQAVSRGLIGQFRNPQMHRGDPRKAGIVRVQSGCDGRETGHQPIDRQVCSLGSAQQALDLSTLARRELSLLSFDQRRAAKDQPLLGAGQAEIALMVFVQTPDLMHMAAQSSEDFYPNYGLDSTGR
jgi:hypothetical protein